MASLGVTQSDTVAILGPNEVAFVEALVATSRLGADAVLLSTFLSAEQLTRVVERENVRLVVVHPDLVHVLSDIPPDVVVVTTGAAPDGGLDLEGLTRTDHALPKQHRRGRIVILTSGTTGVPKSARRPAPSGLGPVASMLSGFPLRAGETIMISSPLFHTWALGMLQLAPAIVSTVVLRRRADAEAVLSALSAHRCTALVGVPVVLDRLCSLPVQVRAAHDTSRLRVVASSGAALLPDLVTRFHAAFGPVLHNLYGATEVSWATIATPQDLEEAPGTVGRAPFGTRLLVLGDDDEPLPTGRIGRVYVGNSLLFDGYSDGGDRPRLGGLIATGDRGWLDGAGRLMLSGREDEDGQHRRREGAPGGGRAGPVRHARRPGGRRPRLAARGHGAAGRRVRRPRTTAARPSTPRPSASTPGSGCPGSPSPGRSCSSTSCRGPPPGRSSPGCSRPLPGSPAEPPGHHPRWSRGHRVAHRQLHIVTIDAPVAATPGPRE